VLAAWAASPARFREDANAEEDLVRGAYRDRVIVELAQNAADAAIRAGRPGMLRLTLRAEALIASNVGAPLDAAGVEALSTLRASAKRSGDTVGRFGVGFAAVLALTDAPQVHSSTGSVGWSTTRTAELVAGEPALAGELARRAGAVPALRLPFPLPGDPEPGWDTTVVLPLRDAAALALAARLLGSLDAALLLSLPGLDTVEVAADEVPRRLSAVREGEDVLLTDDETTTRWRTAAATGRLPAELLANRPTEERDRADWSLLWAVPVTPAGTPLPLPAGVPAVVHAPTPTDEPLTLPALLIAPLPLDAGRRQVSPGPLRDWLLDQAAAAYVDLLRDLTPDPAVLRLVPTGLATGGIDARLRAAVGDRLPTVPLLPAAEDAGLLLRPRDAVALDLGAATGPALDVLRDVVPGLLPEPWCRAAGRAALDALGVRRLGISELVDLLAGLNRPPAWWRQLYAVLADAPDRDALGSLPVPLADGGSASGPRGLVLAGPEVAAASLAALGLRAVHPEAADPLLLRLGAVEATPRALLAEPRVRAAVEASYDAEDPGPLADAVLALVGAAGLTAGEEPWLAELALPAVDGEWHPAGELLLPGAPLAGVVEADAPFGMVDPVLLDAVGPEVLVAVGVLRTFAVVRDTDVPVDPDAATHDLADEAAWLDAAAPRLPAGSGLAVLPEFAAVRDLEFVAADRWDAALELLAEPPLRALVTEPALVRLGTGARADVASYTRWWLSRHPVLAGRRPGELRLPGADPMLGGLYDEVAGSLDPAFLRALGCPATVADVLADDESALDLLARLGDARWQVERGELAGLYARLAAALGEPDPPPTHVRAVVAGKLAVVAAESAVVAEAPDLLPLVGDRAVVPAPAAAIEQVARLLDVELAGELAAYPVVSTGSRRPVPPVARELLSPGAPAEYREHDPLRVLDAAGNAKPVPWRYVDEAVHVDRAAGPAALGRALAWAAGMWPRRLPVVAALTDPAALGQLAAEADFED
jgi:hypothetical protein